MPGLLAFHAHPDDEVISTGGALARYVAAGEEVVVVTATDGAEGEIHNYDDPDSIRPRLAEVRAEEIAAALSILGVRHHRFLGYRDSGMMGTEANGHPQAFWQADFMEATGRLVEILRRFRPEVMVIYDPFGGYGHPDHIQIHRVGMAAYFGSGDLGRFPSQDGVAPWQPHKLYMTTWPRSRVIKIAESRFAAGAIDVAELEAMRQTGVPDEDVTTTVEVAAQLELKLAALKAHRTQIPTDWFLLALPPDDRDELMGVEAYLRLYSRIEAPFREDDLFAGLR